jgi:5-methylcytosine-specific restriction endonuclease McrA
MIKDCLNCGKEFTCRNDKRIKYCSSKCQKAHHRIEQSFICKYCGKEFHPKGIDRITYCSRECAFADKKAKPKRPKEKKRLTCVICGKEFEGKSRSKYCSDECRKQKARNDYYEKPKILKPRNCKWCNKLFIPEFKCGYYACCSEECNKKWIKHRDKNNIRRHRNSVSVAKRERIWKRDNYICQLCGKKLKMDKLNTIASGKPHPLAPTADHIIPQSIAKEMGWNNKQIHAESNLQSAHFICNIRKGNRAVGEQLRIC